MDGASTQVTLISANIKATYTVEPLGSRSKNALMPLSTQQSSSLLTSSINGRVIKIMVSLGDQVKPGQILLVIEAMKMENIICAHVVTSIAEIFVVQDSVVKTGQILMRFHHHQTC